MNVYVVNCGYLVEASDLGIREMVRMVGGKPTRIQEAVKARRGGTVVLLANSPEEAYDLLTKHLGIPDLEMEIVDTIPVDKARIVFQHNI